MRCYLLLLSLFTAWTVQAQKPKQPDFKKRYAPMPAFQIKRIDGSVFTSSSLKKDAPTVLFIFSPSCDHCEQVLSELQARTADFKTAQFVFIVEERQKPYMKAFLARTGFSKEPLFRNLGYDASNLIYYIYTSQALPQVNVYDRRGRLAHSFSTTIPLDSVQALLN